MESYYDLRTRIRYYGQLPRNVSRSWESGHDAAGRAVRREVVIGEMDFTSVTGSVVEVDGRPHGFAFEAIATAADQPLDLNRRREPVHEVLANLILDAGSLYRFTKQWGFIDGNVEPDNRRFLTRPEDIAHYQELLQKAWRGDKDSIEAIAANITACIRVNSTGAEIAVNDPWNLARILFLRDHSAGTARMCASPDCPSPYFLQQRRGQKYCTHKCAVLMNVRRFREREATTKAQPRRRQSK